MSHVCPEPMSSDNWWKDGSGAVLMGMVSDQILKRDHNGEERMEVSMTSCLLPHGTTGQVWQKLPTKMRILPPNGWCEWQTFRSVTSTHDKTALLAMGALSQMISVVSCNSSPRESVASMEDSRSSLFSFTGTYQSWPRWFKIERRQCLP